MIVDEAQKMSLHQYSVEIRKTRRFELGELLRESPRPSRTVDSLQPAIRESGRANGPWDLNGEISACRSA